MRRTLLLPILLSGSCIDFYAGIPCSGNGNCPTGYYCGSEGTCETSGASVSTCPDDVTVDLGFVVMDAYEASRADATVSSAGTDDSIACSRAGVLPWEPTGDQIATACEAAGKRLCSEQELTDACTGSAGNRFPYGNEYISGTCNDESGDGAVAPTGSFPDCVDASGQIFDLIGNVADGFGYDSGAGWVAEGYAHGGGYLASPLFSAECGGRNNFTNSGGDPGGFRCCQ